MKTEWDYTSLAEAYLKRASYSSVSIDRMCETAKVKLGGSVCDIGAGVAHLTVELLGRGMHVVAIEPNDAMRERGIERTSEFSNVEWVEATGEDTKQQHGMFDLITFGSSFNVCDRQKALRESYRVLRDGGWFACLWNHRNLEDPIQKEIENIIKRFVTGYQYGTRREDQTAEIDKSNLFQNVVKIEGDVEHKQYVDEVIEAWRSHGTLQRQAGNNFNRIINAIEEFIRGLKNDAIIVPYTTKVWMAKKI